MVKDIVPELLNNIEQSFDLKINESDIIKQKLKMLADKKATYEDASDYAIEVGEILSSVFKEQVTADVLPDGKMYFNIADRVLTPSMKQNHELISNYASNVQEILNEQAGIRIKSQNLPVNDDRIKGIVDRISNESHFDDIKWILGEPIVQFSQSVVDELLQNNLKFHYDSGLQPYIERTISGHKPCPWCRALAGRYRYPDEVPDDVYRRHSHCRCKVTYLPNKNSKKVQDVHSKQWHAKQRSDIIEERKGNKNILSKIIPNPKILEEYTPNQIYEKLRKEGYEIKPLKRGSLKNIDYKDGGGFKVNFEDGGLFQYHPEKKSHHGSAYYKISTGTKGVSRYDLDGNEK